MLSYFLSSPKSDVAFSDLEVFELGSSTKTDSLAKTPIFPIPNG